MRHSTVASEFLATKARRGKAQTLLSSHMNPGDVSSREFGAKRAHLNVLPFVDNGDSGVSC